MDSDGDGRRQAKSATAFRTISEVAQDLDVPQHVLRFWESKFPQVKPLKRGGGRRYYRPEDIVLLRRIRQCLYQEGYTIRGVQRLLREGALKTGSQAPTPVEEPPMPPLDETEEPDFYGALDDLRRELLELRDMLRQARKR